MTGKCCRNCRCRCRCNCNKKNPITPGPPWSNKAIENPTCKRCQSGKLECYKIDEASSSAKCYRGKSLGNHQLLPTEVEYITSEGEHKYCEDGLRPIPPLGIYPVTCYGNKKIIHNNDKHTCWLDRQDTTIENQSDVSGVDFTKLKTDNRSCNDCKNARLCTTAEINAFLSPEDNSVCLSPDIKVPDSCQSKPNVIDQSDLTLKQVIDARDPATYLPKVIPEQCRKDILDVLSKTNKSPCIFQDLSTEKWWCGELPIRS